MTVISICVQSSSCSTFVVLDLKVSPKSYLLDLSTWYMFPVWKCKAILEILFSVVWKLQAGILQPKSRNGELVLIKTKHLSILALRFQV